MVVEKTQLSYALAVERDLFDISWLLQILQETILDYDKVLRMMKLIRKSLCAARRISRMKPRSRYFHNFRVNETEFLIRPAIEYDITDSTKIKVGAIFEGGDRDTMFGQFDGKDRLYVEVKYSF